MPFGQHARRLCDLVGIRHPIIQAPMAGGWVTPELVAAVANAGGLGMLAGARQSADQLAAAIDATRRLTTRPFGVNFLLAPPEPFSGDVAALRAALRPMREQLGLPDVTADPVPPPPVLEPLLDLVADRRVPIVSFALGNPERLVGRVRAAGALVIGTATTAAEAVALEQAGVDGVVAQGAEAGGHRSTFEVDSHEVPLIGTMVLVPQVVDRVRVPVIASGGIMDGRGLLAALSLGASGVQMGTRFLTAVESGAFPDYRERVLRSDGTDTTVTRLVSGRPARSLRNRFVEDLRAAGVRPLAWPYQGVAAQDVYDAAIRAGQGDFAPLLAGQGGALARRGQRADEIVVEVVDQARSIAATLAPD